MKHPWQMHDWDPQPHRDRHIPHAPLPGEIQMATRDAPSTPQPHGLYLGSFGTHVPLPSESKVPQFARTATQTGQPLGYPNPPSPSDRIHVPDYHGTFRQPPELLNVRRHHLPLRLLGGHILRSCNKLLPISMDRLLHCQPGIRTR